MLTRASDRAGPSGLSSAFQEAVAVSEDGLAEALVICLPLLRTYLFIQSSISRSMCWLDSLALFEQGTISSEGWSHKTPFFEPNQAPIRFTSTFEGRRRHLLLYTFLTSGVPPQDFLHFLTVGATMRRQHTGSNPAQENDVGRGTGALGAGSAECVWAVWVLEGGGREGGLLCTCSRAARGGGGRGGMERRWPSAPHRTAPPMSM